MPLPYATIFGFGFLVVAAGLLIFFANQQQVPIGYDDRRRRSVSPPRKSSWNRVPPRETSGTTSHRSSRSTGSEHKASPTNSAKQANNTGYACIICLDSAVDGGRFLKLRCTHRFHSNCLVKWFQASQIGKVCPTCKTEAVNC